MDFDGGQQVRRRFDKPAAALLALRDQADALGIPVVYVNDNHGHWHSERSLIVEHCLQKDCPARDLVSRLAPRSDDYFVIKPHLSGFYATSLPVLLPRLGASRLVLTGVQTDACVLFTAAEAHMRDYDLWVPSDAVACESAARGKWALEAMQRNMDVLVTPSHAMLLKRWALRRSRGGKSQAGRS